MRAVRFLLAAFLAPASVAQFVPPPVPDPGDLTLTIETDKDTYAYGETIIVTTRVRNVSDDRVYLGCPGFECVSPPLRFDEVDNSLPICVTMCDGDYAILGPGREMVHTYDIVLAEHFLPYAESETHTLSATYSNGLEAAVEINAPQFEEGRIWVRYAEEQASAIETIRVTLSATVLSSRFLAGGGVIPPRFEEQWAVEGFSGEQAVELFADDPAFAGSDSYGLEVVLREIDYLNVTVANEAETVPVGTALTAAPNPFSTQTTLSLTLPAALDVEAVAYDVLGRRVAVLHEGVLAAGTHALTFEAARLPAGVYVVRVLGDDLALTRRVTLAR
ncbi:MAG: T9SS type A sorting domain-containing protein [Bacteroidota bacterium]